MAEDEGWRDAASSRSIVKAQGDASFKEFFVRCWGQVQLAVSMRAADDRFVEDEVQEAFLLARRNWEQLRHFDKPEWWVMTVALRRLGRLRARERRQVVAAGVPATTDPIAAVAENERVYAAIRQLPRRQAEAIILFTLGYSVAASAEILGVTPGSIKKHRFVARKRLREMLESAR